MKHRIFILIFALILIICSVLCFIGTNHKNGELAEIYVKGKLLHEINLSSVDNAYEIELKGEGHKNIVFVEKSRISITHANCPDKLCVKQGAISNSSYPIVCLPNEVIIKIKGNRDNALPDAISK